MGIIRFLLAFDVAMAHGGIVVASYPLPAGVAVQAFFIISGFYMALVLDGPYKGRPLAFYANRALRIYPAYWSVALMTLAWLLITGYPWHAVDDASVWTTLANIFIVGIDFVFMKSYQYLLISPAWSIAVEFLFYALAPFIVRLPTKWLAAITAIGIVASFKYDQPYIATLQLPFFMVGVLAYRTKIQKESFTAILAVSALVIGYGTIFTYVPVSPKMTHFMALGILAALIPFLNTKHWLDTALGDLAYPVYLVHYPVMHFMSLGHTEYLLFTLALSWLIVIAIERRVSLLRDVIRASGKRADADTLARN